MADLIPCPCCGTPVPESRVVTQEPPDEVAEVVEAVRYFEREQGVKWHLKRSREAWAADRLAAFPAVDVAAQIRLAAEHGFRRKVKSVPGTLNTWLGNARDGGPVAARREPYRQAAAQDCLDYLKPGFAIIRRNPETGEVEEVPAA